MTYPAHIRKKILAELEDIANALNPSYNSSLNAA